MPDVGLSPDELTERHVGGLRLLKRVRKLLGALRVSADHFNRKLHFDEYAALVILYFFNPLIASLRGLQRATEFKKVRKALRLRRMSLGSMSESVRVFDPDLLQGIVEADASFVARWHENVVYEEIEARELTDAARAGGVTSDRVVWLGYEKIRHRLTAPVRLVEVHVPAQAPRGLGYPVKRVASKKTFRRPAGEAYTMYLVTDRLDLPADVIALIYRHRWQVELFFRVLKSVFGCRHLLSDSLAGVTIQLYAALIATLLLAETTGLKPTQRAYELVALYLQGWVKDEELAEHLARMKRAAAKKE